MDAKISGKQIAIQVGIQIVGSLIAGVILYQFFKPKDEDTNSTAARTTTRTTVVESQPTDEEEGV